MKKTVSILLAFCFLLALSPVGIYSEDFVIPENPTEEQHWGTVATDAFAGGKGTKQDPYYIATPEQLAGLSLVETEGVYFELIASINLSAREWRALPAFAGNLCGNGYTVSGMSVTRLGTAQSEDSDTLWEGGFVSCLAEEGVISDIVFDGCKVSISDLKSGDAYLGTVAGRSEGALRHVFVSGGAVECSAPNSDTIIQMGGIAGSIGSSASVEGCSYNGSLTHTKIIAQAGTALTHMGGIAGSVMAGGCVKSCYTAGYVMSSQCETGVRLLHAGGMAGVLEGSVTDCGSTMNVMVYAPQEVTSGGIAGKADGAVIDNCYATGAILAGALNAASLTKGMCAGGLVGLVKNSTLSDCYTKNTMVQATAASGKVSGMAGKFLGGMENSTVTNCYTSATTMVVCSAYNAASNSVSNLYMPTNTVANTSFAYSEVFLAQTLGWGMYKNIGDMAQASRNVWIYTATDPTPAPMKQLSLTVRYLDTTGGVLDTYLGYYDEKDAYSIPSPTLPDLLPDQTAVQGTIAKKTFIDVVYTPHTHTPGEAATCTSGQICTTCGKELAPSKSHLDENEDYRCDLCHEITVDVNYDKVLNISDVNDLLTYLAGSHDGTGLRVDVDENGIVNVNDLNIVLIALSRIS